MCIRDRSQNEKQIATESEVRELAKIHNVELKDVFPNTSFSNPYYEFNVDDQEFDSVQIRPSGELVGDTIHTESIKTWIQQELHTGNE